MRFTPRWPQQTTLDLRHRGRPAQTAIRTRRPATWTRPRRRLMGSTNTRGRIGAWRLLGRVNVRRRGGRASSALPRQAELVSLFGKAGANMQAAAERVCELLMSWPEKQQLTREVTRCEQEGDQITREIIFRLHRSRIGPAERGAFYALAEAIDDIVDEIEEASEELAAYSIEAPMEQAQALGAVVRDSARAMRRALDGFNEGGDVEQEAVEIRDLEHEG